MSHVLSVLQSSEMRISKGKDVRCINQLSRASRINSSALYVMDAIVTKYSMLIKLKVNYHAKGCSQNKNAQMELRYGG